MYCEQPLDAFLNLYLLNFSLRIPLVNESTEIRAATLRTIRHLTTTSEAARAISTLNIHYLIRWHSYIT